MRIAYLHRISFEESEARFIEEVKNLGFELVLIKYRELSLIDTKIYWKGIDLATFDGWYFRSVGTELEWAKILELYAKKHGIKVVDEYLLTQGPLRRAKSVMGWQLLNAGVNYPKTKYIYNFSELKKELQNTKLPVIVKVSQGGRHGMGTFWIRTLEDLQELEKKGVKGFLIQEYIPNDGDYRVMTVGYKVIGGFKRAPKEEKLVMNKSIGKSVAVDLPADVIAEAEKAARAVEVEVSGIDLVRDDITGKVFVLEVNEAPQFKVFEKRTKINAARAIMSYLKTKFENGHSRADGNLYRWIPAYAGMTRGLGVTDGGGRVLVLGRFAKEYEPKRILEEARKNGKADVIKYGAIKITEDGIELPRGKKLTDYDLIVARSASKKGSSMVTVKTMVLLEAGRLGIPVINGESFLRYPLLGKTEQGLLLNKAGLPAVEFVTFGSKSGFDRIENQTFPVMVKGRFGSHGRTVRLVNDVVEFKKLIEGYKGENVLIQPVLPVTTWFRAIVCRGEYLGEMKHRQKERYKNSRTPSFVKDYGRAQQELETVKIKEKDMGRLREICLRAAKLFDCDYCGIDVGWREDKKDWVIFEVNRTAQFKYFEKRTGVNVAARILGL